MSSLLYSPALDAVAFLGRIALSPLLSGPILLSATYTPNVLRDILVSITDRLPGNLAAVPIDFSAAKTGVQAWFFLGILYQTNNFLNNIASNSWRLRAAKDWDWATEIAVVTGGSSGIGRSIAEKLAAMGVQVAVFDIQGLPKELETNQRIRFYQCDVTSTESVAAAADAVRRELGHPSILINNAGITRPVPILKMPESFLRRIMGVNLMSLWFTTQQFLPRMIQQNKGHIVTVASIASFVALGTVADYSATKAGALAFHESLACEIKHFYKAPQILTTVVHPNFVDTPLIQDHTDRLCHAGVRLLTSDQIADKVISQVKSRKGGQLIIPSSASVIAGIRGWPTWLQELLRDIVGKAMAKSR